jgi:hypothetical protein
MLHQQADGDSHKNYFHQPVRFASLIDSIELKDKFPALDVAESINGSRLLSHRREKNKVGELSSPVKTWRDSRARRRWIYHTSNLKRR